MASSLRKLGKRLYRTSPPDIPGADERDPQRLRQESPENDDSPRAVMKDFSIPAPPPKSLHRHDKKTPPPKKLQKYKSKSPAAVFANSPDVDKASPTSSQGEVSKGLNSEGGISAKPPRLPTVRRVSAQGCEFEMMDAEYINPAKSVEDLSSTIRQPASEPPAQRTTRSSTRRQSRQDSLQEDQDNISNKDFAIPDNPSSSLQIPGLSIRKKGNKIPATTPTSASASAPASSEKSRRKSIELPRTPSPRDPSSSPTPPPTNFSRPTPTPSPTDTTHYSASSPTLVEAYKASTPLSIPETIPYDNDEPLARALSADEAIRPETVKVRPPIYDMTKTAAQQWEHPGITSSRPERAWDGSPRWTCCVCEAQTIVEQIVCANLECGHDRCYNRCQVFKETKKTGLFWRG